MFGWLVFAKYGGERTYEGVAASAWELTLPAHVSSFLLLTRAGTNTPLFFEQNVTLRSGAYSNSYRFLDFTAGGELPGLWDGFDPEEYRHPKPCPLKGPSLPPPTNQTIFIFHPRHQFNITRQDNGDLRGDAFFVCQDLFTNSSKRPGEDYQWITQWTLEHVPRYGQYQNCNGYPNPVCIGAEDFWVGHEAAIGMGQPNGGRCARNQLVGEWFSLPLGGQCRGGARPDGTNCTWRASRVKTIDAQCLFGHGYVQRCLEDRRAPFVSAEKLFTQAFASIDPAAAGCPALPGPLSSP